MNNQLNDSCAVLEPGFFEYLASSHSWLGEFNPYCLPAA